MDTISSRNGTPAVCVEHLSFRYGERQALRDINLDIESGEVFALLGPNGGGKTTLFRILSTLVAPSEGRVSILGCELPPATDALRRRLGIVFQSPGLDGKLTVAENLYHHGRLYGLDRARVRERSEWWLERLGIADRANERVELLSGGLARRTEIARSLIHDPELLILDEPSTGLDPGARRELGSALRELAASAGVTVVLTTHYMEEADRADRVAILEGGRIVTIGTPEALKAEVGHEVLVIQCDGPSELQKKLGDHLSLDVQLIDGDLRIEASNAHCLVGSIMDSFGTEVRSLSVGRPTLEDVFVHLTGHRFWLGAASE